MRITLIIFAFCFPIFISCCAANQIKDFSTDGCSLFPDRSIISGKDWCECCFNHDIAYWQGGSKEARLEADEKFRSCILKKTGNKKLADFMFRGVRIGGSPYFFTWYRWGYGWSYERKYKELSVSEKKKVKKKLNIYFLTNSKHPCQ